jgi:hypothetical protein
LACWRGLKRNERENSRRRATPSASQAGRRTPTHPVKAAARTSHGTRRWKQQTVGFATGHALARPHRLNSLLCSPQPADRSFFIFVCLASFVSLLSLSVSLALLPSVRLQPITWRVIVVVTGRGPYTGQGPHLQVPQFIPRAPASPQMLPQQQHGGGPAAIYPSQFGLVPSLCHLYISSLPKFYSQIAQILHTGRVQMMAERRKCILYI